MAKVDANDSAMGLLNALRPENLDLARRIRTLYVSDAFFLLFQNGHDVRKLCGKQI